MRKMDYVGGFGEDSIFTLLQPAISYMLVKYRSEDKVDDLFRKWFLVGATGTCASINYLL